MSRVGRLVSAPGWKRALGEFALIVVGVLVALWVNDWNQARQERARERADLRQLLSTTRENEERLRRAVVQDSNGLAATRRLLAILTDSAESSTPPADSVGAWESASFRFAALSPLTGTYTALAGSGDLNLLRNAGLRAQVATYAGELGGDIQEMAGWFETFNRNAEQLIRTLPRADLHALARGRRSQLTLRQDGMERALLTQAVVLQARLDILHRLLGSTTDLRKALEQELGQEHAPTAPSPR